jgi:FkbM family methyltransferase
LDPATVHVMIGRIKRALLIRTRFRRLRHQARTLGGWGRILRYRAEVLRRRLHAGTGDARLRHARGSVVVRRGTTDLAVFAQVFIDEGYREVGAAIRAGADVGLVIDCGANVGYSAAYMLSRWPRATMIAVEPDPDNFAVLRQNLAPFAARATAVQAGVWSHSCGLVMADSDYRGGGAWARQVREARPGEPAQLSGADVGSLLAESGHDRISVLKMDIEGAECVVFSAGCCWLDRVDVMAIELHDDTVFGRCSEVFQRAVEGRGFAITRWGELTICRRERSDGAGTP